MYEVVDAALLRLAASPAEWPGTWPDVTTWDTVDLVGWLRSVSAAPGFTDAVEVASPVLADRISRMTERRDPGRREVQRVVRATTKYVLRARTRATPFGLFAGVAALRLGPRSAVRLDGGRHHVRARIDASWMAAVLERLHRDRRLVRRLPVTTTDLAVVRDGRLLLPRRASTRSGPDLYSGAATSGSAAAGGGRGRAPTTSAAVTQETSVRLTPAVAAVMELTRVPVPFTRLTDQLAERFEAPVATVEAMLFELVDHQLLLTALHAPITVTDPLTHLVDVLSAAPDTIGPADAARGGPNSGDDDSEVLVALQDTAALLVEHDRTDAAPRRRDLRGRAADRMRAVAATERQVGVDLRLDVDVVLPAAVGTEAAWAAEVMTRLARPSDTSTPWGDYHRRFLDRYGPGAVVGVQDLLHGADGLGYPAGYRDSTLPRPTGRPSARSVRRDAALLDLAYRAAWDRLDEIQLAEADLLALTDPSDDGSPIGYAPARPHTEIRAELHAASCAAMDRGEFTLAVLSVSRGVGTITGRFLDLLDPRDRDRMRAAYTDLPTVTVGALRAQVSCPPITASATTVSRTPPLLPASIALAQPPAAGPDADGRIPLSDLAVSADTRGCYLVSVSRNRPIEPHLFGAVELVRVAHPTLRFLAEISTAAAPVLTPFAWGPARELPHLPRIRHGRTVLAPARWRLRAADLAGRGTLTAWRERSAVPDRVLLGDDDRRLRLDLTEPAHRDVLLDQVHRTGAVTVLEAPPDDVFGWIDHRPHEIVLPLAATTHPPHPARPRPTAIVAGHAADRSATAVHWVSARLFGRPEQMTRVLVDHLATLLDDLAGTHPRRGPGSWFLRHSDPEPHLRLRVPLSAPDGFGDTAQAIRTWAAPLVESGLLGRLEFDTYRAETGRFGGGAAMDAAHAVFAADSAAALAQLRLTGQHRPARPDRTTGPDRRTTTAAGLLDLVVAFTGDAVEGRRWLLDHVPRSGARPAGGHQDRTARADTLALVGPHLHTLSGGADVAAAWQRRADALAAYRAALARHGVDDPNVVLPDLLHLHHARTIGLSLESEHRCLHRARTAALAQLHRQAP